MIESGIQVHDRLTLPNNPPALKFDRQIHPHSFYNLTSGVVNDKTLRDISGLAAATVSGEQSGF